MNDGEKLNSAMIIEKNKTGNDLPTREEQVIDAVKNATSAPKSNADFSGLIFFTANAFPIKLPYHNKKTTSPIIPKSQKTSNMKL